MKRMHRAAIRQEALGRVTSLTKGSLQERLETLIRQAVVRWVADLDIDLITRHSVWNAVKIEEEIERALRNERKGRTGRKPRLTADLLRVLDAWMDVQVKDLTERQLRDLRRARKAVQRELP